jgi:uncharacterized protein (DUF2147 family)
MQLRLSAYIAALLYLSGTGHAVSAEPTPVGLWQAVDKDIKRPTGWFLISNHGGVYRGTIAKMFLKPGQDPNQLCTECKDDRHNHPWLGLEIIRGMRPEGDDKYGGGTILDPRDGKVYKATMTLRRRSNVDRARLHRLGVLGAKSILDAPTPIRLQRA